MNTTIDDTIYMCDKEGKYITVARTKAKLYCAYQKSEDSDDKYYLSTVKDGNTIFLQADYKQAEAVKIYKRDLNSCQIFIWPMPWNIIYIDHVTSTGETSEQHTRLLGPVLQL